MAGVALVAGAQEPAPRSDIATVGVTVTGRTTESPRGLAAADFRVLEDGREQTIMSVSEGPGPISIAIVLDPGDSMLGTRQRLGEQAVERMTASLTAEEEATLVMFRQKIVVAVPWTRGPEFPRMDWTLWQKIPLSDILSGVRTGLFMMDNAAHPRRAVVAITNTDEYASTYQLRQYVVTRAQSETAVYGVRTDDYSSGRPQDATAFESGGPLVSFEDVVRDSGGRILPVKTTDDTQRSSLTLLNELRHQYVIRFSTTKAFDGSYRRLKVELRKGKDLRIRHRLGYLAKAARG